MKKFILEALEDENLPLVQPDIVLDSTDVKEEPTLSEEESKIFHTSVVSDLLTKQLENFNTIQSILADPANQLDEVTKVVLTSVNEDISIIIGKLQRCLQDVVDDKIANLIDDGEQETQAIIINTEEQK